MLDENKPLVSLSQLKELGIAADSPIGEACLMINRKRWVIYSEDAVQDQLKIADRMLWEELHRASLPAARSALCKEAYLEALVHASLSDRLKCRVLPLENGYYLIEAGSY